MSDVLTSVITSIKHPDVTTLDLASSSKTGLPNLGNTCYLNSILQILLHNRELMRFFLDPSCIPVLVANKSYKDSVVAAKFVELFVSYWTKDDVTLSNDLKFFKRALGAHFSEFEGSKQNDQHECITYLLDLLHQSFSVKRTFVISGDSDNPIDKLEKQALESLANDLRGYEVPHKPGVIHVSPISDLFLGQSHARTECVNCHNVSHRFDTFNTLQVQIPKKKKDTSSEIDLYDCLNYFTSITQLDKDNMFTCDNCKVKNRSRRRTMLWRLPKVLIVHIVRNLKMIKDGEFHETKDPREVELPLSLDLSKYVSNRFNKTTYDLEGVGCHHGMPSFGHCTSYLCTDDKGWHVYDDSRVNPVDETYIQGPEAYLAFYRLRE